MAMFQTLDSSMQLNEGITREVWFCSPNPGKPFRRTLYKLDDGSVVALEDTGSAFNSGILYFEEMFRIQFEGEPEMETILKDAGKLSLKGCGIFNVGY